MGRGVRITVTTFKPVREFRKDDVRIKLWTGTRWAHLNWCPYTPYMADLCGVKAHSNPVVLDFPPPGTVPIDRLLYLKEVLPRLRRSGLIH